jgi:hypothetical protein
MRWSRRNRLCRKTANRVIPRDDPIQLWNVIVLKDSRRTCKGPQMPFAVTCCAPGAPGLSSVTFSGPERPPSGHVSILHERPRQKSTRWNSRRLYPANGETAPIGVVLSEADVFGPTYGRGQLWSVESPVRIAAAWQRMLESRRGKGDPKAARWSPVSEDSLRRGTLSRMTWARGFPDKRGGFTVPGGQPPVNGFRWGFRRSRTLNPG